MTRDNVGGLEATTAPNEVALIRYQQTIYQKDHCITRNGAKYWEIASPQKRATVNAAIFRR